MSEYAASIEPVFIEKTLWPVASFWRRFFAWVIDAIILVIVGEVIGNVWFGIWYTIGQYGRIVGFLIVLVYFGWLQSEQGGGQSLGKRILGTAVRTATGEPLGFGRSLLRIFILALPAFLSGWFISDSKFVQWILAAVEMGLGVSILFTMVFNRQTRQGLHDLLAGTYVVYRKGKEVESLPVVGKRLMVSTEIVAFLMILLVTAGTLFPFNLSPQLESLNLNNVVSVMQPDSEFFGYNLRAGTMRSSSGKSQHVLLVTAQYRGIPGSTRSDEVFKRVAGKVLLSLDQPEQYDLIVIDIVSVFDLGIGRGSRVITDQRSPSEWLYRINLP
jgi:uncharacterized RDD family membrane protein YckC